MQRGLGEHEQHFSSVAATTQDDQDVCAVSFAIAFAIASAVAILCRCIPRSKTDVDNEDDEGDGDGEEGRESTEKSQ